jgi:hypothetical protein
MDHALLLDIFLVVCTLALIVAFVLRWTNPLTGRTYTFWTWIMDSCPGYTQGSLVSILVDPSNPKRYIMEL